MSTAHNSANVGDIAKTVLLPGDPLRAKYIAETYLEEPVQFNAVRNVLGYTGTYRGQQLSVMGTGMGCPSIGIYSYELIHYYHAKTLIRIGSCGGAVKGLNLGDLVFAMGSSTNSSYASQYSLNGTFSALASYDLLEKAVGIAREKNISFMVGNILCSDIFYRRQGALEPWLEMGIIGVEMETYALYCNAAQAGVHALGIYTVSDGLLTGEHMTAKQKEVGFRNMMEVALEAAVHV